MLEYVLWAFVHFGGWGLMLIAAAGVGHVFLRKVRFTSFAERLVFTLALGLGLWALALFFLGLVNALYRGIILALTLAVAAATLLHILRRYKNRLAARPSPFSFYRKPHALLKVSLITLVLCYWLSLLLLTQYPPIVWDATSNHLVLARAYLERHRIVPVTGVAQPIVPALNHMLFVWGLALRDDILSQMMEHTLLMLAALGLYAWGKRENRPLFGLSAACFWLAHPMTIVLGRSAYTDVGAACYVFVGLYALRVFWTERRVSWWYVSMSLLGLSAGAKLSGLFFLIFGSGVGLLALARAKKAGPDTEVEKQPGINWKTISSGWALALFMAIPWFGYIAYETGNPVWPTFPQLSRGMWGAPHVVENYTAMLGYTAGPRTLGSFLRLSLDWQYHPERFQAEAVPPLLPLIIIWPVAWGIALWSPAVRWWAAWALAFTVFWFFNPQHLRYWMPALPLAGLALYESIRWFMERFWKRTFIQQVVWAGLILFALVWGGRRAAGEVLLRGRPPVSSGARVVFLTKHYGGYKAVQYINERAGADDRVCIIGGSWLNYYFNREVIDLVSPMYANRRPAFQWPNDSAWTGWLELNNAKWIYISRAAPQGLYAPNQISVERPIWPDYELVYGDSAAWVFRRKPVSTGARLNLFSPARIF